MPFFFLRQAAEFRKTALMGLWRMDSVTKAFVKEPNCNKNTSLKSDMKGYLCSENYSWNQWNL